MQKKFVISLVVVLIFQLLSVPALAVYTGEAIDQSSSFESTTLKGEGVDASWEATNYSQVETRAEDQIACTMDYNPVCGKDANTYSNECMADVAGVVVDYVGECVETEKEPIFCTKEYNPVCGENGQTYSNKCTAEADGAQVAYEGECKRDVEIRAIEKKAELLSNENFDEILLEVHEIRNLTREQQNQAKYLPSLLADMPMVTEKIQNSINNFITYGVDENTKKLGEGERAAVMHSFKSAYGKLPENEEDLSDVIKIANGRFPGKLSEEAENVAKETFVRIYKRDADMSKERDKAAVIVMAYGLRQKAENRKLETEKNALVIYKSIFGKNPENTKDWNVLQAIAYSGASK